VAPAADASPVRKLEGTLEVQRFDADGVLQDRAIVYAASTAPDVLFQHRYQFWTDTPSRMLQDVAVNYLRSMGIALQIVTPEHRIQPNYTLSGNIKRMEHLVGESPAVSVEIEFGLRRESDGTMLWLDDYRVSKEVASDDVALATVAISEAVAEILAALLEDISGR
jgi:ABC-type uncharacterized transport system auxiliary subunit